MLRYIPPLPLQWEGAAGAAGAGAVVSAEPECAEVSQQRACASAQAELVGEILLKMPSCDIWKLMIIYILDWLHRGIKTQHSNAAMLPIA